MDEIKKEECRKALKQIAWRLQYQAKKLSKREMPLIEEIYGNDSMSSVDSKLFVEELLHSLPEKARFIIQQVVIDGVPEKEEEHMMKNTRLIPDLQETESFCMLLKLAKEGDNQALEQIISLFEQDMEYHACFIKMPREDSIQQMKAAFIEIIRYIA